MSESYLLNIRIWQKQLWPFCGVFCFVFWVFCLPVCFLKVVLIQKVSKPHGLLLPGFVNKYITDWVLPPRAPPPYTAVQSMHTDLLLLWQECALLLETERFMFFVHQVSVVPSGWKSRRRFLLPECLYTPLK